MLSTALRKISDLRREHEAALDRIRNPHFAALVEHDIDGHAYVAAGLLGVEHVEFAGPVYVPSPAGEEAFIALVTEGDEIVDLLAWSPENPDRFAPRTGGGFCLGHDNISFADWHKTPLVVHRTPLGWLRAGCTGICILRPADAWGRLNHIERVIAEDEAHARQLRGILRRPWPAPTVTVAKARRRPA